MDIGGGGAALGGGVAGSGLGSGLGPSVSASDKSEFALRASRIGKPPTLPSLPFQPLPRSCSVHLSTTREHSIVSMCGGDAAPPLARGSSATAPSPSCTPPMEHCDGRTCRFARADSAHQTTPSDI